MHEGGYRHLTSSFAPENRQFWGVFHQKTDRDSPLGEKTRAISASLRITFSSEYSSLADRVKDIILKHWTVLKSDLSRPWSHANTGSFWHQKNHLTLSPGCLTYRLVPPWQTVHNVLLPDTIYFTHPSTGKVPHELQRRTCCLHAETSVWSELCWTN